MWGICTLVESIHFLYFLSTTLIFIFQIKIAYEILVFTPMNIQELDFKMVGTYSTNT